MAGGYGWGTWRKYGAAGAHGGEHLAAGIERMVTGIASPPDSKRGIAARLTYLTRSKAGRSAMREAGISARTIAAWVAGKRSPSTANRAKLDAAYWGLRRQRVITSIKQRLSRGVRIEIDPVNQSGVIPGRARDLEVRHLTVRPAIWDRAVDAWAAGDDADLGAIWEDLIVDIGSDYDSYTHVSSVGWAA